MALFVSPSLNYTVHCNGIRICFDNGFYQTEDAAGIDNLKSHPGYTREYCLLKDYPRYFGKNNNKNPKLLDLILRDYFESASEKDEELIRLQEELKRLKTEKSMGFQTKKKK